MPAYGPRQKVETTETHQTGGHLDEGMSLQLLKSQSPLGNKSTRPSSAASSPSPKGGRIDASEKASSTTTLGNLLPFGATDSSPTSPVITDAHLSKDDGDQKKKAPSTNKNAPSTKDSRAASALDVPRPSFLADGTHVSDGSHLAAKSTPG